MQPIHDTLAESLKRLRTEESFLVALIERARTGQSSNPDLLHHHRRELARVRSGINQLLPQAMEARAACSRRLLELTPQAEALRSLLGQVREQARARALTSSAAAARATALQAQLEQVAQAIAARERELKSLDEFLPGGERTASSARPAWAQAAPVVSSVKTTSAAATTGPALALHVAPPAAPLRPAVPALPPVVAPRLLERRARPSAAALLAREASLTADLSFDDDSFGLLDLTPDVPGADLAADFEIEAPDDELLPALGEAFERSPDHGFEDPLLDRSRATFTTARRERRASPRLSYPAPMKFRAAGMSFAARCADVSRGGMFLETASPPELGSRVTVVFCAEGYPLEIDAEVMYLSAGVGLGVRFRSVAEDERPYLEGLLRELAAKLR